MAWSPSWNGASSVCSTFEAISLARGDNDTSVEVKPVLPRVTPAERRGLDLFGRIAAPPDPRARPRPYRDHSLYRRSRDPSQDRRLLSPSIGAAAPPSSTAR